MACPFMHACLHMIACHVLLACRLCLCTLPPDAKLQACPVDPPTSPEGCCVACGLECSTGDEVTPLGLGPYPLLGPCLPCSCCHVSHFPSVSHYPLAGVLCVPLLSEVFLGILLHVYWKACNWHACNRGISPLKIIKIYLLACLRTVYARLCVTIGWDAGALCVRCPIAKFMR